MNVYTTQIQAIDPYTGDLKTWAGPLVMGISFGDAENNCRKYGLGYCRVVGLLIAEITNGKMIDYEHPRLN